MLEYVSLQVDGSVIIASIIFTLIICGIFYAVQKRNISSIAKKIAPIASLDPKIQYDVTRIQRELNVLAANLTAMQTNLPHTNEVTLMQDNVRKLCDDFTHLQTNLDEQMNKFKQVTTEDFHKTKDEMLKTATEKITEHASSHLGQNSVTKSEFENLKQRVEKMIGFDVVAERMEVLLSLFDSTQIKTINWQCRLIKMLDGGLAPDAEEELIVSRGIPKSSYEKFLKKLTEMGIAHSKSIQAYYLVSENEWIYSYIENPDLLQRRLELTVKKEKEYQNYIRDNMHLIEDGLLLENAEYQIATGKIDFICRDKTGRAVGLELKYPVATSSVKSQILGYKNDYNQKTGTTDTRFIVVAPLIPNNLKALLADDGIEYKEIEF